MPELQCSVPQKCSQNAVMSYKVLKQFPLVAETVSKRI